MSYPAAIKKQAVSLRKQGKSIPEIAKVLHIAKSTISLWVKNVELPEELKKHLTANSVTGREKGLEMMKAKRTLQKAQYAKEAVDLLSKFKLKDRNFAKLYTALLFWCEGAKIHLSRTTFTNSDPKLIKTFLYGLRNGFNIDEKKFRALIHLHSYHNEKTQIHFWSKVTKIPVEQFHKSYQKSHTQVRKRENYAGCISISYYDATVARKLDAIYHAFAENVGP